jgi:hypothetical protein
MRRWHFEQGPPPRRRVNIAETFLLLVAGGALGWLFADGLARQLALEVFQWTRQ